jgi:kynureninase
VLVSAVLFETSRIVPGLGDLAAVCRQQGAELVVDAYHALGCMPLPIHEMGLSDAWIVGGGYKYLQLGEGNCCLRLPEHAERMRPVITGWFSEFPQLSDERRSGSVGYGPGGWRFAGGTYDPTSNYRAARVFRFFTEKGLSPQLLRQSYRHQVEHLARELDALDLPDHVVTRDRTTPLESFGGFLAVQSPHARQLHQALKTRGVMTDYRGRHLRLGPAPYLSDQQLSSAIAALGEAVT